MYISIGWRGGKKMDIKAKGGREGGKEGGREGEARTDLTQCVSSSSGSEENGRKRIYQAREEGSGGGKGKKEGERSKQST
jgi:hypothetical protein